MSAVPLDPADEAAMRGLVWGDDELAARLFATLDELRHRMTLKEAAALLGVTPDNLRGAIARGALKAAKVGRDWHVTPREVERYRKEHRRG